MKNKFLIFLLGALGFATGCEPESENWPEYGSPYITYTVKGKITDDTGARVGNIKITGYSYYDENGIRTSAEGLYEISRQMSSWNTVELTFSDTDGPANGGEFEEQTVELNITEADRIGDGDGFWCKGEYAKTMDVTLKSKDE